MALFTAYFDATGNAKDQPFVVVSGYIASVHQWRMFNGAWIGVHEQFGVKLPFHMNEFMAAQTQPDYASRKKARQDYVEIAKNPKQAEEFFNHLCMCQVGLVNCGVSCILTMDVYTGVSSLLDLREVVPPYALAARMCIERVHQWENYFRIREPVKCVFEEGDFEQGKFTELMVTEGMGVPIYEKKDDHAGLQAADLYAWEQANFLKREHLKVPARTSFALLIHEIPILHVEPTTATLINLCQAKGIDPTTGVRHGK